MPKHRQTSQKKRPKARRVAVAVLLVLLLGSVLAVSAGAVVIAPYASSKMDLSLLEIPTVREPAILYAYDPAHRPLRQGELHPANGCELSEPEKRVYVPYEEMPPYLIQAFVAIEDKHFFDHHGVDFPRTAYAGVKYLMGNGSFGASTITQQLVKNLTGHDEYTPKRKMTEIFMALDLEKQVDKETILETYLNVINLAGGCQGVGAAAERYYGVEVSALNLPQCATIAAITNNPARYDPLTHPDENKARRDLILRQMEEQGYITPAQRDQAIATDLELAPQIAGDQKTPIASWYADMVAADVIRDLCDRLGYTRERASRLLYSGGLTIETAMDEDLQALVEEYYRNAQNFPTEDRVNARPQSSFILIDPATGDILAVAGAVGEKTGNRLQNYATDTRRPAGSSIKPLSVFAPALERGLITWASIYEDEPLSQKKGMPWPANADGLYRGRVTVSTAVAKSLNPVAVRILSQVGEEEAFAFLRERLGMRSLVPPTADSVGDMTVSSLALGQQTMGVTSRELTAAYTVFRDGVYRSPLSYHRVLDKDGRVLLENPRPQTSTTVLSPATAALMTRLLMTVAEEGTAARHITLNETLGIQVAGKTGTTQNNCDRWFVGYTPRLLAGVWMGYDYPTEMKGISGNPCVGIWDDIMTACETQYRGAPTRSLFPSPAEYDLVEAEYCPLSGGVPHTACTANGGTTAWGWFLRGTEPMSECTVHEEPPINVVPEDPGDPNRIPHLPNDTISDRLPRSDDRDRWYSRWFNMFARPRERVPG